MGSWLRSEGVGSFKRDVLFRRLRINSSHLGVWTLSKCFFRFEVEMLLKEILFSKMLKRQRELKLYKDVFFTSVKPNDNTGVLGIFSNSRYFKQKLEETVFNKAICKLKRGNIRHSKESCSNNYNTTHNEKLNTVIIYAQQWITKYNRWKSSKK